MRISHTVSYKEQLKAIERMAKKWFKERGSFKVTFSDIGEQDGPDKDPRWVIREGEGGR